MRRKVLARWSVVAVCVAACSGPNDDGSDPDPDPASDVALAAFPVRGIGPAGNVVTLRGRLPLPAGSTADAVSDFLSRHARTLGLRDDLADLVIEREDRDRGGTTLRYRQLVDGIPVFEGELVAGVAPDGALLHVRNSYDALAATVATTPRLDRAAALSAAGAELGAPLPASATAELVIVRGDKHAPGVYLAWQVGADVPVPRGDWLIFVDALAGRVVRTIDMLKSGGAACTPCNPASDVGCGKVFHENPVDLTDNTSITDSTNVDSSQVGCFLNHLTSGTSLIGTYANTTITAGARVGPPYNYARSVNQNFVDEINVYYHLDRSKARLDALGFPTVMNFSINTDAHEPSLGDNSHYVPSGDYLEFGPGGVDDAQDADVVHHEYGHAIQDNQVPGWGGGDEGSMGEGFGDYWAAALTDDQSATVLGAGCVAAYDAVSYNPYNGSPGSGCLRRVDGSKQFPRDRTFEVHDDGEIWSSALWRLRGVLGGDTTDALVIKSHTFATTGDHFIDLADAMHSADLALNGGANAAAIDAAFVASGLPRTGTPATPTGTVSSAVFSCGVTNYANNQYKECIFTQPGAQWMRFHFTAFDTEPGFDFAYISDAQFRQVQALDGTLGAMDSAVVAGDTIVLRFKADGSITRPGFNIDRVDYNEGCQPPACTAPATCSYEPVAGAITVTMIGQAATLTIASGNILLDGATCAALSDTDSIVVEGTGALTVIGDYVPGRTAEPSGQSEIEFTIGNDVITFDGGAGSDTMIIVPTGADLNGDGDQDVTMSGAQTSVTYRGGAGNDTLDASAMTNPIILKGGAGTDHLIGGGAADTLYGQADADTLEGGGGIDNLYGGDGNDTELGGDGDDVFREESAANGADVQDGGPGNDTAHYGPRTVGITVTLGDGIANEGEPGENDQLISIANVTGGAGNDSITGSSSNNVLRGGGGNDTVRGSGGNDILYGDAGDDLVDGGAGSDTMYGNLGNDNLVGDDAGTDRFLGNAGDDIITGNADGIAETVSCGDGNDTAQTAAEDTITSCEILTP